MDIGPVIVLLLVMLSPSLIVAGLIAYLFGDKGWKKKGKMIAIAGIIAFVLSMLLAAIMGAMEVIQSTSSPALTPV
jgi:hypothetical protein